MKKLILLVLILAIPICLLAEIMNTLEKIEIGEKKDNTLIKLLFSQPIDRKDYRLHYNQNVLSIDLKRTHVLAKIPYLKDNSEIKKISFFNSSPQEITISFELKESCQKLFKENRIKIGQREKGISILVEHSPVIFNKKDKDIVDETLDEYVSPFNIKNIELSKTEVSKTLPSSPFPPLIKGVSALFVVLGTILLCSWGLKKMAKKGIDGKGVINVLAIRHLSSRQMIAIVEIANERLVLGITPTHITTLATLKDDAVRNEDFVKNFNQQTLKARDNMSHVLNILKEKMGELKQI